MKGCNAYVYSPGECSEILFMMNLLKPQAPSDLSYLRSLARSFIKITKRWTLLGKDICFMKALDSDKYVLCPCCHNNQLKSPNYQHYTNPPIACSRTSQDCPFFSRSSSNGGHRNKVASGVSHTTFSDGDQSQESANVPELLYQYLWCLDLVDPVKCRVGKSRKRKRGHLHLQCRLRDMVNQKIRQSQESLSSPSLSSSSSSY